MQSNDLCGGSLLEYVGDACAAGCAHCAHAHNLPQRVVGCCHGDNDVGCGGGGGDYCYDVGGYDHGGYGESPPHPHPPPPPPLPPSPQAGACGGASGYNL